MVESRGFTLPFGKIMFFDKKSTHKKSLAETAKVVFGQSAAVEEHHRSDTLHEYPFLSKLGDNFESDYRITGRYGNIPFVFSFPVKFYSSERSAKFCRYDFLGYILTIQPQAAIECSVYGHTGKPFRAPDEENWNKEGKYKGVKIFSKDSPLSFAGRQYVERIISWIESGFSAVASPRYAVFFQGKTVHIAFQKPDFYYFEAQLSIIAEMLGRL